MSNLKRNIIIGVAFAILLGSSILIYIMAVGGFEQKNDNPTSTPTSLNDIAHDIDKRLGFTVYIPENGEDVPYYVLTNNFNDGGNCLLLRKYLLDEDMPYRDILARREMIKSGELADPPRPSYYEGCYIDNYLCGEFLESLSAISDIIIESEIIITAEESKSTNNLVPLTIKRKAFLLSEYELGGRVHPGGVVEGVVIKALSLDNRNTLIVTSSYLAAEEEILKLRRADYSSGERGLWWLRTADTWDDVLVAGIGLDGGLGYKSVGGSEATAFGNPVLGVRPAFCLPPDTAIYEDVVDGEKRYFISLE